MGSISAEFYEKAKNINEVRQEALEAFLRGAKIDESVLDVYRRAERFLVYVRRIRKMTAQKPQFITHWVFLRFLGLAMKHQGENLSDDKVRAMVLEEFKGTKRTGNL